MTPEQNLARSPIPVPVWDLPVRLFHWTLVALLLVSWWTGEEGGNAMIYHLWSGYGILTLVIFRLLWGLAGSPYARFRQFLRGPRALADYALGLLQRKPSVWVGHNPLGGWVIMIMLLALLVQAMTGLFANDDIFIEGPLYPWVSKRASDALTSLHKANFNLLLALAALHVAAALFYLLVKRENLITPMITGRKWLPAETAGQPSGFASPWLAVLLVTLAGSGVYWLVA